MKKSMPILKDLPHMKNRLEKADRIRVQRLKEAKDIRNFKTMIQLWANDKTNPRILSEKQRIAIHFLTDFVHNYSYAWVAAKVQVSEATISKWRNDPMFIQALDKEITRRKSFMRLHAFRNVNRALSRGDMKATWQYLKMTGDLKENVEVIDRTGEHELSEQELNEQISELTNQLEKANVPSTS